MQPLDFITMIAPYAQEFQRQHDLFASVAIAQACLETGYGKFIPVDDTTGANSYNLFGVKEFGSDPYVTCTTWEVEDGCKVTIKAKFRAYPSFYESIADHAAFLMQPRYERVRNASTPQEAANLLYTCGYATDPQYGAKLNSIIAQFNLTQYDISKEDDDMSFLTDEQKQQLVALLQPEVIEQLTPTNCVPEWAQGGVGKMEALGAQFSGAGKLPAVWQLVRMIDGAGIFDDALAYRKAKGGTE